MIIVIVFLFAFSFMPTDISNYLQTNQNYHTAYIYLSIYLSSPVRKELVQNLFCVRWKHFSLLWNNGNECVTKYSLTLQNLSLTTKQNSHWYSADTTEGTQNILKWILFTYYWLLYLSAHYLCHYLEEVDRIPISTFLLLFVISYCPILHLLFFSLVC